MCFHVLLRFNNELECGLTVVCLKCQNSTPIVTLKLLTYLYNLISSVITCSRRTRSVFVTDQQQLLSAITGRFCRSV